MPVAMYWLHPYMDDWTTSSIWEIQIFGFVCVLYQGNDIKFTPSSMIITTASLNVKVQDILQKLWVS